MTALELAGTHTFAKKHGVLLPPILVLMHAVRSDGGMHHDVSALQSCSTRWQCNVTMMLASGSYPQHEWYMLQTTSDGQCNMHRAARAGFSRASAAGVRLPIADMPAGKLEGLLHALRLPTLPGLVLLTLCCVLPLSYMIIVTSKLDPQHRAQRSSVPGLETIDTELVQHVLQLESQLAAARDVDVLKRDLLWALAGLSASLHRVPESSNGAGVASDPTATMTKALVRLQQLGHHLPCISSFGEYAAKVCGGGCLFASNVHNSEPIMPNFITQMLTAISVLSRAAQPIFISIYESGSTDSTASWLLLLDKLLAMLGVNKRIVISGLLARSHGEDRIHFLASVRNAVLEPLRHPAAASGDAIMCNQQACPAASRVVFINDVYFCAGDLLRLLQYDADIACGLDFIKVSHRYSWHLAFVHVCSKGETLLAAGVQKQVVHPRKACKRHAVLCLGHR